MTAPEIICQLVQRFEDNRLSYRSGRYNETQLRHEFLDPFFKALGWDVNNEQGYAEAYKDVINEDSLEVEGAAKAPDYAFRIGGTRKFFVEAKKPSVNIEYAIHPAFQLRRYAWSAKLPLSILTDFEEFAVYESRSKPDKSDSAGTGRVMLLNYKDYPARWEEIAAIFSREAVLKGSFDKYAKGLKGKKGTMEVDDAFLVEIEGWRDQLARNIALRNSDLDVHELNYAVQMTIDRIVFLRICEDRGIEREDQLQELLEGEDIYERLCQLFRQADNRYNSGLFHFAEEKGRSTPQDNLTQGLKIDDKVLKDIISDLYYPSPYVFKEIPADILGQVYERFLGKVIRLTAGHQAKVEEKPEVRKAGGVYYTPTYIVDYIVRNTVGKLLDPSPGPSPDGRTPSGEGSKMTPKEAARIKILDLACGSGSFLLGAYQYMLDWHTKWYSEHETEKWAKAKTPPIYQAQGGDWRLTTTEKRRILLNNLYGVDIDPQAVEVTKLSLSLKVLEGESQETIGAQLGLFKERALPDLGSNIKCGNSLIGPDYYEGHQLTMNFMDNEERYRVNAFNWQAAFPQIFIAGGFDAVIGNPPYIRIQAMQEWAPTEVEFYKKKYTAASKGNYDIYVVFVEKGLSLLNKKGQLGIILPSKFFATDYGESLRNLISERQALSQIVDFGHLQVFEQATTYTCLLFLSGTNQQHFKYAKVTTPQGLENVEFRNIENSFTNLPWVFADELSQTLTNKTISCSKPLCDLPTRIGRGSSSGADDIFMLHKEGDSYFTRQGDKIDIEPEILRIPIYATDFGRYEFRPAGYETIIFPYRVDSNGYSLMPENEFKQKYPKAFRYLASRKKELEQRKQYKDWYSFSASRNLDVHETAQILVPLLANKGLY
ncbi:MAG: Eco57I restriction-modification methylase domain-containing protein, partial [Anaerolineales bacterium]